jgi:hypothetical protein
MRFRGSLLIAAFVAGLLGAAGAGAQELSVDPSALDASVSTAGKGKKAKARPRAAAAESAGKPAKNGKTPDRQFGELEGWSPGKAPPKPKEKEDPTGLGTKAPIGVSPSGNMSVGVPF